MVGTLTNKSRICNKNSVKDISIHKVNLFIMKYLFTWLFYSKKNVIFDASEIGTILQNQRREDPYVIRHLTLLNSSPFFVLFSATFTVSQAAMLENDG